MGGMGRKGPRTCGPSGWGTGGPVAERCRPAARMLSSMGVVCARKPHQDGWRLFHEGRSASVVSVGHRGVLLRRAVPGGLHAFVDARGGVRALPSLLDGNRPAHRGSGPRRAVSPAVREGAGTACGRKGRRRQEGWALASFARGRAPMWVGSSSCYVAVGVRDRGAMGRGTSDAFGKGGPGWKSVTSESARAIGR